MPSVQSEDLKTLYKGWVAALAANPSMELDQMRRHLGPFDPKAAAPGLVGLLARAADVPDFATLEATVTETEAKVRKSFERILGAAP